MKIGILTQPLHNNYGGILQAYALCKILVDLGHDPIIINRVFEKPLIFRKYASRFKNVIVDSIFKKNVEIPQIEVSDKHRAIISQNTRKFISKYIPLSEECRNTRQLRKLISDELSTFIVGSDQVWRPKYSPRITNYFLDFTKDKKVKKISYAASFGVDFWEFTEVETNKCSILIKDFDAISVREDSGVDLCSTHFKVNACHVLDPTMLLTPDKYKELIEEEKEPAISEKLMAYILDGSPEKDKIIKESSRILNLHTFSIMPKGDLSKYPITHIEDCIYPKVTNWLRGFMDAEFVITDSFHGCVFSILFNIPFFALGNKDRGMARITSLLKMFNLEERILSTEDFSSVPNEDINWNKVNKILEDRRRESIDFLINNLN